ncbi:MAG: MFS transporter [Thermoguttaceae bacterium]
MGKMNSATLRLVLLISCCHALVHVYEHSFACVEQLVVADDTGFGVAADSQKAVSGKLGNALRLPFGMCALVAGWFADRYGAKRLLLIYLLGCSFSAVLAWFSPNLAAMYLAMFTLGLFCSIYHPAGVGLISHHTNPENRPMALGYHGIFGSIGIASGPFLAGLVLNTGATWQQYYMVLAVPGVLLAGLLKWRLAHGGLPSQTTETDAPVADGEDDAYWPSYLTLITIAAISGFVYAAILNFLPRYLDGAGLGLESIPEESMRNYLTGGVLLLGVVGQYAAGRLARPSTLEPLMAFAFFAAAPCVLAMAFVDGYAKIWVAGLFSPLFFMHQPLYNSLVAKYVPRRRRSLCYGLSFTLGFGVGSFGPTFSGYAKSELLNFGTLSAMLLVSGILSLVLWRWHGPVQSNR